MYCYELFADNDRSVWMPLFESTGMKYAAVIAICEQNNENDMGFTAEAMKMPLEALGYRVVSTVKILHLFDKGEAKSNERALTQSRNAGKKLADTMKLRSDVDKKSK